MTCLVQLVIIEGIDDFFCDMVYSWTSCYLLLTTLMTFSDMVYYILLLRQHWWLCISWSSIPMQVFTGRHGWLPAIVSNKCVSETSVFCGCSSRYCRMEISFDLIIKQFMIFRRFIYALVHIFMYGGCTFAFHIQRQLLSRNCAIIARIFEGKWKIANE